MLKYPMFMIVRVDLGDLQGYIDILPIHSQQ